MLKKSWKELMDRIQEADKKTMLLVVVILVFSALFLGTLIRFLLEKKTNLLRRSERNADLRYGTDWKKKLIQLN